MIRVCTACREGKPETDFYIQMRDGYKPVRMTICKACHKARVRRRAIERKKKESAGGARARESR